MRHRARKHDDVHRRLMLWRAAATVVVLCIGAVIGIPAVSGHAPVAHAAGTVYIDEPLQGGSLSGWDLQGAGNVSNGNGSRGASWLPRLSTVVENNAIAHSYNTNQCMNASWPTCTAGHNAAKDSRWLTLTTDDTNDGRGQAGTALHNTVFDSALGVVLEYDQRVYRTNNGRLDPANPGVPRDQGGGDGMAVYLADAAPSGFGNGSVDTSPGDAGGYGAGLGYSAVSNDGSAWCPAQQGVPGGYVGVGFDVYGNYQKAENETEFAAYHRATRPFSVAQGNPVSFASVDASVKSARIPQSIGLRGSGVRYSTAPACSGADGGMNAAYGLLVTGTPLVTNAGMRTVFQVKWAAGDSASSYAGEYQAGGAGGWMPVSAKEIPASLLPAGFADPRGYVMFTIPDSIASFSFRYTKTGNATTGIFAGISRDVSLGNAPAYTALDRTVGGYRWLAGTNNLSSYPNPATEAQIIANDAALRGAVIDNAAADSTRYRRIRITVTPGADGSRAVKVFWTDKLDVSNDRCYNASGAEITGVTTSGGIDGCANAGGSWRYGQPYTFREQFSYNLAASPYQADLPARFRLGFSASTGWAVNYHQIRNVRVTSVLDLAVEKKVQSTGSVTTVNEGAWADSATLRGGENVAYRVKAWNNGLSDLDPAYPATLTDGLQTVPFSNPATASWTATATGGAQICTTWNVATSTCSAWATTLSGTGPLTDASPLRWHAPATSKAPSAAVTVVFTGPLGASVAPAAYPNTASVATSGVGGPQEDDVTNNQDGASITVLPGWSLAKSASPASGAIVRPGDTITYTLNAKTLASGSAGAVSGVTVTDTLAEVNEFAQFNAGSVRIGGAVPAAPVAVTEPSADDQHRLTISGLNLPGGTTVPITYTVTVKDPVAPGDSFRNFVVGALPGNPPVQCADADESGYLENCSTEHRTPALLQVLKVGENTGGDVVAFDGSEWAIHPDAGGAPAATPMATLAAGQRIDTGLLSTLLEPGEYWLIETKALDGFALLPAPVAFTVAADGSASLAAGDSAALAVCPATPSASLCDLVPAAYTSAPTIVVLDVPVLDLPDAGGSVQPSAFFIAGAAVLIITSAATALILTRRRPTGDE